MIVPETVGEKTEEGPVGNNPAGIPEEPEKPENTDADTKGKANTDGDNQENDEKTDPQNSEKENPGVENPEKRNFFFRKGDGWSGFWNTGQGK